MKLRFLPRSIGLQLVMETHFLSLLLRREIMLLVLLN